MTLANRSKCCQSGHPHGAKASTQTVATPMNPTATAAAHSAASAAFASRFSGGLGGSTDSTAAGIATTFTDDVDVSAGAAGLADCFVRERATDHLGYLRPAASVNNLSGSASSSMGRSMSLRHPRSAYASRRARSRTIATMPSRLRPLALLALLSPACWSGFAEVHVAAGDASAPGDRPTTDRPLADAPRAPDGAQDATADTGGLDALSLDVVDAGGLEDRFVVDAPDVPAPEDARDAGLDAVDAPELRDVVALEDRVEVSAGDAPPVVDAGPVPDGCAAYYTPCPGACAVLFNDRANCGTCGIVCGEGTQCVRGLCSGPTRFLGAVSFDPSTYARDPMALARWDALCAARYGSEARVCTPRELDFLGLGAAACAAIGDADGGVRLAAMYLPAPYFSVDDAGVVTASAVRCRGRTFDGFGHVSDLSSAVCCSAR